MNMPLLYGEGEKAFLRLQEEIIRNSNDETLLAWGFGMNTDESPLNSYGCFALSPKAFAGCSSVVPFESSLDQSEVAYQQQFMTNQGLRLRISFANLDYDHILVHGLLNCCEVSNPSCRIAIPLQVFSNGRTVTRDLHQINDDTTLRRHPYQPPELHYDSLRADAVFRTVYIMKKNHEGKPWHWLGQRPSIISISPPAGFTPHVLYMSPDFRILDVKPGFRLRGGTVGQPSLVVERNYSTTSKESFLDA